MADNGNHWSEQSIQPDFQQAASPEQEPTRQQEEQEQGSEMVGRSQPVPEPPRPEWAPEIDRQSFNRQWEAERQRAAPRQQAPQQQTPERSISDDFNFKADELERAKRDAENTQERVETLKGYARPVNQAEKAIDDLEEDEDMSF